MSIQLPLFEDDRPLPLIVAEKFGFPLQYHIKGESEYWYAIQDWVAGITQGSSGATRVKMTRLRRDSTVTLSDTVQKMSYQAANGRTYQVEFGTDYSLYQVAQAIRPLSSREQFPEIYSMVLDYLAASGVLVDEYRRDPARQAIDAHSRLQAQATRLGQGDNWAEDRIDARIARRILTDLVSALVEGADHNLFVRMTNITYKELFGGTAADLRRRLGLSEHANVRNHLSALALSRIRTAEIATGIKLEENGSMAKQDFLTLVKAIAVIIGRENRELEALLNVDMLTGHPLLTPAESTYGEGITRSNRLESP